MNPLDRPLFDLNPKLDSQAYRKTFDQQQRVQIRDFLSTESAQKISDILRNETPWGLAWRAGEMPPESIRQEQLAAVDDAKKHNIASALHESMASDRYAFQFHQYPMLDAYLGRWNPDSKLDRLLEYINDAPFLDLVREVTGFQSLIKADAQATLYTPGQFLALHNDSHVDQNWRVAYVMNFCPGEWRPDWGGYLQFFDDEGDIIGGFRPRFNALNLFAVPQKHNVSYVAPYAPFARYAVTGWFRDR